VANDADARIILETLRLTRDHATTWTYEISSNSRATASAVRDTLSRIFGRDVDEQVQLGSGERFKLAFSAARSGGLLETARTLDWKEFEKFADECLRESQFETERNVRLKDGKKRWEIDVVARKGSLLLCLDCKHWSHSSPQRLRDALVHQKKATTGLISIKRQQLMETMDFQALPIVLTLFGADDGLKEDGVIVSIDRLQDFLQHLTPYDPEIPFIRPEQKPIK
jgi:Holliday junction resolvase-like predicted endonuclease